MAQPKNLLRSEIGTNRKTCGNRLTRMYIHLTVARKKVKRTQDDVREYPSYSIEEVARYIGVPVRTLRSWVRGYKYRTAAGEKRARPIIEPADPHRHLLSFYNLAEAQVLAATREKDIPLRRVRRAVEYLRDEMRYERPLLRHVFHSYGQKLFIKQLGATRLRQPLDVSYYGQYGIREVLRKYLERIDRDPQGRPLVVYPLRPGTKSKRKNISIHPLISSGKPSVRGSGVMAEVIWRRAKAGESIPHLARDYRLKPGDIKAAIQYCKPAA